MVNPVNVLYNLNNHLSDSLKLDKCCVFPCLLYFYELTRSVSNGYILIQLNSV